MRYVANVYVVAQLINLPFCNTGYKACLHSYFAIFQIGWRLGFIVNLRFPLKHKSFFIFLFFSV